MPYALLSVVRGRKKIEKSVQNCLAVCRHPKIHAFLLLCGGKLWRWGFISFRASIGVSNSALGDWGRRCGRERHGGGGACLGEDVHRES